MSKSKEAKPTTAKRKAAVVPRRRTRMIALEPRMLFDGALGIDLGVKATQVMLGEATTDAPVAPASPQAAQSEGPAQKPAAEKQASEAERLIAEGTAAEVRQEIVFVDVSVRDFQKLIDGIDTTNTRVVLLDPAKDGVKQMLEVVKQYDSLDAIHLISHGTEGQLNFGSSVLNATTLGNTYAADLAVLKAHLSAEADLLIYGCDFGKGAAGEAVAQQLAQLTGADVASSDDATGHASLGGDWDLERRTGSIETDIAVSADARDAWRDVMALRTLDFDTVSTWTSGLSKTYTVDGYDVTLTLDAAANGNPTLASNYTGGLSPAQNALQFVVGGTGSNTITMDFSAQPGGSVSNVGFSLFDVDNAEAAQFTATLADGTVISPTQVATSAFNSITAGTPGSGTSVTVGGTGTDGGATSSNGNVYVYFNVNDIRTVSFTYSGNPNVTLVTLHDITFMGTQLNPPILDLDSTSTSPEAVSDGFATQSYANASGGAIPWTTNWIETDNTGGGATGGKVQVVDRDPTAAVNYALRLNNTTTAAHYTGASREIDLSAYSNSVLTFDYMTSNTLESGDSVVLEISRNGGANFTLLKTYSGNMTTLTSEAIDIAGYESTNTVIRFRVSGTTSLSAADEYFYVDNLQVSAQPTGSSNAYTEGDATGVLIAASASSLITDPDTTNMASGRVTVQNFAAGDQLTWNATVASASGITASYDAGTGVLTLTGTASKTAYQDLINTIRYSNAGDDPTVAGTRDTAYVGASLVDSGGTEGNVATSAIALSALNDAPGNSVPAAQSINEDTALVFSSGNGNLISVSDPDAATVQVQLSVANGTLSLSGTAGLTFNAGANGSATMTFTGTQAAVNAALSGMSYDPSPDFVGSDTLTILTSDLGSSGAGGTLTDSDTVDITVLPVNDAPLNTVPGAQAAASNAPLVFGTAYGNGISVSDVDSGTLTVTLGATNGRLTLSGMTGLTFTTGDGTNDSTMTFSGSTADINAALNGLQFMPNTGYTGAATLSLVTSDGALSDSDNVTINLTATTPPRVDLNDSTANETASDTLAGVSYAGASGGAVPWSSDWVENDPEGAAQSASEGDVQIVDTPVAGTNYAIRLTDTGNNDGGTAASRGSISRAIDLSRHINASLSFALSSSGNLDNADDYVVEVSSDGGNSFVTLATYENDVTGTQTVSLSGYESANTVIRFRLAANFDSNEFLYIDNVTVTAEPSGHATTYTENGAAVAIADTDTIVTDDGTNINRAVITISNAQAGDQLTIAGALPGGITLDASSTSTTLVLIGSSSKANYQTAIEAIRFSNTGDDPGSVARLVEVSVRDTTNVWSNTAVSTIDVVPVNDAPTGTDATVTTSEDTPHVFAAANFGFSDVDSADTLGAVRIDSLPAAGALQYDTTGSGNWTAVSSGQVISAADIGANRLRFTPAANANGASYASFTFSVRDGSTFDAAPNTITVDVAPVNDAPVLATGSTLNYTENGAATAVNTSITVSDPDNATLSGATVSITGGFQSGQDVLSYTNNPGTMGNIAGSYDATTGVMTLSSAGNTATVAQWQAALRAVQYSNSSDNPSTSARTVSFVINDSAANSNTVTSTINVTAVNDATVIGGVATSTVSETNSVLSTGGQLTSSDPDSSAAFNVQAGVAGSNGYGSFSVDASGAWTYTTGSALNNLAAGQTVTDSFTVTTADGTSQVVTVTINGTDDATVIGGVATATVTETNAALSTGGQLTSSDPDS
ncbi:MAG TPA: DUF4347 domain-containing protein, partial [Burkholderiales bacterium]|nr:DUF4347 domain-containing protein [Burkholderiales bacterium]